VRYASNWSVDFEEIKETPVALLEREKKAVTALIDVLIATEDPDAIQNGIFNAAKNNDMQPRDFFKTLYTIMMGAPQGPKLGPYVLAMGKQNVVAALQRALSRTSETTEKDA
jgi:lysyl-tRNA synthetase class 1